MMFSAPGKIHLLGEHSVVYGKPAILAAIDLRAYIKVTPNIFEQINSSQDDKQSVLSIKTVVEKILKDKFELKQLPPYEVEVKSDIPLGSGLGSSAAVSAALLAALVAFLGYDPNSELVNELTFEAEKAFHGNPSGGDNTTVVYGGLIWYRKELDFLKTFSPLPFTIHPKIKQFLLVDSGKPMESTKEMVEKVNSKFKVQSSKLMRIFDDQERLTKELAIALKEGQEDQLIDVLKQGERNLESLGVVGEKAKKIIRAVEKIGGAAKILGGGGVKQGSGMLLCYHTNTKALLALAQELNLPAFPIKLGEEGLRAE